MKTTCTWEPSAKHIHVITNENNLRALNTSMFNIKMIYKNMIDLSCLILNNLLHVNRFDIVVKHGHQQPKEDKHTNQKDGGVHNFPIFVIVLMFINNIRFHLLHLF